MIDQMNMLEKFSNQVNDAEASQEAWKMLAEIGLPTKKSEAYKFTPIQSFLEKNTDWGLASSNTFKKEILYKSEGSHLVFINGVFEEGLSNIKDDLTYSVGTVKEGKHDPFSLLNAALATNELNLKSGTKFPVFLYYFNNASISSPRVKIHVSSGQTIEIIEKLVGAEKSFTNSYIQFEVEENAFAYHTKVQKYDTGSQSHETVFAEVKSNSHFINNTFSFESVLTRNNLTINLIGENCEGHMYGLFLLDRSSHIDNNTTVDHAEPNSYSNELYKGILDDKATGVFNGKIYVRQNAQNTNAFQSNNNILLSESATLHTKPQLEIWADDVKCSHGCTSGQLDKDAIFYLRARGIDQKSAKAMLLQAFAAETLVKVKLDIIKEEVLRFIDQKLI